jgi:type IV secretion system protein VirB11
VTAQLQRRDDSQSVYLDAYLKPFERWLGSDDVTEILVNAPGEVWIERAGVLRMKCEKCEVDDTHLRRLAEQVARVTHQGVNREHPLLSATLPDGARIQMVGPPATRRHWALAIRRYRLVDLNLDDYSLDSISPQEQQKIEQDGSVKMLREAVAARKTILISGGTSTGKTTFLNSLLREVPEHERVILVEDTPEIRLDRRNALGLLAIRGDLGEAKVTTDDLLHAALHLRPDRIVLGEIRGVEAVSFLRAINTGHPGSFTTVHANSPRGALEQIAFMVMQSGLGLSSTDTICYARSVIDIVVQLDRKGGKRAISEIIQTKGIKFGEGTWDR